LDAVLPAPTFEGTMIIGCIFKTKEKGMSNKIELPGNWVCDGKELKPKTGANSSNTFEIGRLPILVVAGQLALRLW